MSAKNPSGSGLYSVLLLSLALLFFVMPVTGLAKGQKAGSVDCGPGRENDAGLCYKKCRSGYKGVGPVCWQKCPRRFRDTGAHCLKPKAYGRGAGYAIWHKKKCQRKHRQGCEKHGAIWYPKCRRGFRNIGCCICSPRCPRGMTDIGVSCQKKSYGRGVGTIPKSLSGKCYITYPGKFRNGRDRRYDQVTWLTTHNAFANTNDGWIHVQQTFNIKKQLEGGVRGLMLDIHNYRGKPHLCHGSCTGFARMQHAKSPKRLYRELITIRKFLQKNRSAIVTILFESSIGDYRKIRTELNLAGISRYIYDPVSDPNPVRNGRWPTINWMIRNNKRLVMFSHNRGDTNTRVKGVALQWTFSTENGYDIGAGGNKLACKKRRESRPLSTRDKFFVMNHFRSAPAAVASLFDNKKSKLLNRVKKKCIPKVRKPPTFLAVDYYHIPNCDPVKAVKSLNSLWERYKNR